MTEETQTWAALLTPPGHGAIATLALWGPSSWEIVRELFRPAGAANLPVAVDPGRLWLGQLGEQVADQVVVTAKQCRQLPWVEVHCHGGPEVVRMLLETFQGRGVRIWSWKELERWSDPESFRALAAVSLTEARTVRTAAILLDQHAGAFERALEELRTAWGQGDHSAVERRLAELVQYAAIGRHLTTPWRVVVAGAPNVGKSSLVNALAGFHRCVVSPIPGTTRDLVTTVIALDGWPVELVDTAGLRSAAGQLEAEGIGRARSAAANADLVLWVLDASAPLAWPAQEVATLMVVNKIDLAAAWNLDEAPEAPRVSAVTGSGLAELGRALVNRLVPEPPPPGAAVPFTTRICECVNDAWGLWSAGQREEAVAALDDSLVSGHP